MNTAKRFAFILAIALVVSAVLSMGAYAAVNDDGGFGFSLLDLLDGIGGFFIDLINYIGSFISKIISAIGEGINILLSGIKFFLVPSKQSFAKFLDDILKSFDNKFGSVFSALDYLGTRFKGLGAKKDLHNVFKVAFPKSSFLSGISIDFLAVASPFLEFLRFCITGIVCLKTALTCYNKVIGMVNT